MNRLLLLAALGFFGASFAIPLLSAAEAPLVSVEVRSADETESLARLKASGIDAIGWTNATVDVSAFGMVETSALSTLSSRLLDMDPRWDPWLRSLGPVFHPRDGLALLWVHREQAGAAAALVGSVRPAEGVSGPTPRQVTGWLLVGFSLFYLVLRLVSDGLRWTLLPWKRGALVVLALGTLGWGLAWVTTDSVAREATPPSVQVSWVRHRWFQEAWPSGARWDDWVPGKAWSYRSYERQNGRLVETSVALAVPDKTWALATFEGLDGHHAARIFGSPNP